MIPNKTEEQILLQNFKYHDLEGLGYCNLRTFIKTHERLGVVLSKIKDIEEIFNHYDHDNSGRINYKQFCSEIFNPPQQHQQPQSLQSKLSPSPSQHNHSHLQQSFIDILNNHLLSKGGSISLMQLLKEIQIVDYNNSNKITIDDFVKVLRECGITLHQNDYQLLFGNYELFANGILYYNELLKQLLCLYWSDNREMYSNELYEKNKGQVDIKELKRLLPKYNRFIECFKFVCKSFGEMSPLNPLEFKNFIKYFAYGIESDDVLYEELFPLNKTDVQCNKNDFNNNNNNNLKEKNFNVNNNNNNNNKFALKQQQHQQQKYKKDEDLSVLDKFAFALGKVNRRTLFSFIKHFRYYEDDFHCVSKYDFLKIIKDYRIDFSLKDIEKLFYEKSNDVQKTTVQYEKLFKEMISHTMTFDKIQCVKDIYDQIHQMSNEYNCDDVTIDFIKQVYKSKHNILNQDESNCKIEFDECIELFHFCYKGYKGYRFTLEEFIEFYSFISLLVKEDCDFISLIQNEFKPQFEFTNKTKRSTSHETINNQKQMQIQQPQYTSGIKRNININNNNNNSSHSNVHAINSSILEQILINRGIRGLIYLHRQFLNSCSDLNCITLEVFVKVLQLQHIFIPEEQYAVIYNNFLKQDGTLDFFRFIRSFKQELNEFKLQVVEDAFSVLDVNQNEQIDIDFIKMNYNGEKHPDVIEGRKHCEEVVLEFYDAFELNYTLLAKEQYVNFEIFANYYEYVAFVYKDDKLFEKVVKGDWGL